MANNIPIDNGKLLGQKKSGGSAQANKGVVSGIKNEDSKFSMEKVTNLSASFDLNNALDKAYKNVIRYMNDMLDSKDLEVKMSENINEPIGFVTDKETGKQVSSYEGKEMLKLYSHNNQRKGIVVDGKI